MDLKERNNVQLQRHPWETARLNAVNKILTPYLSDSSKIIDVGCGDGFIARGLCVCPTDSKITAIDMHLTESLIQEFETLSGNCIRYLREMPEGEVFDLVLLMDVLEHTRDDRTFLVTLVDRYIVKGGRILISVPAFQFLYCNHDVFLGHFRRYRLNELKEVAKAGGLKIISSGYLHFLLLLPKLVIYKLLDSSNCSDGVGKWRWGKTMTSILVYMLNVDNNLLFMVGRLGIKIPGLTGWVLCQKQG